MKFFLIVFIITACAAPWLCESKVKVKQGISFFDDFEKGAAGWDIVNPIKIKVEDSGDPRHGKVLALYAGGPGVYALVKNSHHWTNIRVEGDIFFPDYNKHFMGLIYNYNLRRGRPHFAGVFIYGPGGDRLYKRRVNPTAETGDDFIGNTVFVMHFRDEIAAGFFYPEYFVTLKGDKGVKPREWHRFKAEIFGPVCHFYIDDMETPKITHYFHEFSSGRVGFSPLYSGSGCRLDNIKVSSLEELSYKGPVLPAGINYKPEKLIVKWHVIGPFFHRIKEIEKDGFLPEKVYYHEKEEYKWRHFETDARGCVVAGKVCDKFNLRGYAYFHTEIFSPAKKKITLEFSSNNNLIIWMNNVTAGSIQPNIFAWYDFWENPDHKGVKIKTLLKPGNNHLLVMVDGGINKGDGFFACYGIDKEQEN